METGFTFLSRLTQIAPPSTRFVFLGAGICLGLPSHPASRRRSCLRLGVSTTSSSRGLSPPSDRPCRAYSRAARCARRGPAPAPSSGLGAARPAARRARRYRTSLIGQARMARTRSCTMPSSAAIQCPAPGRRVWSLPSIASHAFGFAEPDPRSTSQDSAPEWKTERTRPPRQRCLSRYGVVRTGPPVTDHGKLLKSLTLG